jgi:hypothetical protein
VSGELGSRSPSMLILNGSMQRLNSLVLRVENRVEHAHREVAFQLKDEGMRVSPVNPGSLKVFPLKGEGISSEFILTGQLAIIFASGSHSLLP